MENRWLQFAEDEYQLNGQEFAENIVIGQKRSEQTDGDVEAPHTDQDGANHKRGKVLQVCRIQALETDLEFCVAGDSSTIYIISNIYFLLHVDDV